MAYGGGAKEPQPQSKPPPPPLASSYADFPSLKKPVAAAPLLPSKPAMNFKDVAKAAASKPAPPPPTAAPAKAAAAVSYYQGGWDYEDEDEDLEITDEEGGLNSRRVGDKSDW